MKIGIDIIEIKRIESSIKNPNFIKRIYSEEEMIFLKRAESFASNFAAKEAFSKAVGTGFRGFSFNEVSILRNEVGAPYIKISGNALKIFGNISDKLTVSISHTKDAAVAVVAIE